jgi:site-specific recombinase
LIESLTGGHLAAATQAIPHGARELAVNATHQGFLSGLNAILLIGGVVAFVGAALALWLVREHEIERDTPAEIVPERLEADEAVDLLAA